jgi:hypothetical protein
MTAPEPLHLEPGSPRAVGHVALPHAWWRPGGPLCLCGAAIVWYAQCRSTARESSASKRRELSLFLDATEGAGPSVASNKDFGGSCSPPEGVHGAPVPRRRSPESSPGERRVGESFAPGGARTRARRAARPPSRPARIDASERRAGAANRMSASMVGVAQQREKTENVSDCSRDSFGHCSASGPLDVGLVRRYRRLERHLRESARPTKPGHASGGHQGRAGEYVGSIPRPHHADPRDQHDGNEHRRGGRVVLTVSPHTPGGASAPGGHGADISDLRDVRTALRGLSR